MKLLKILVLSLFIIIPFGCAKENDAFYEKQTISLKYITDNRTNENITIEAFITENSDGTFSLNSDELLEVEATYGEGGEMTFGYVLISQSDNRASSKTGYFYNSGNDCFYYGTMYYGENGVNIFVPYTTEQYISMGVPPVCSPPGGGFA